MSGDYSRKRFDPTKHYSGVLQQQGRVALDADGNEDVAIQDRRWRTETLDVVGRCGVPTETPDGFKIENSGGGLTIGPGRIYVDGFLAENHGQSPLRFNRRLEENYGSNATDFDEQPYLLMPSSDLIEARTLAYIDVWKREVDALKAPDLVEPAVDVDTTTRSQTVWQVKLLSDIGDDVDCDTPLETIPGWPEANLSSAARLTTSTVAADLEEDPCLIPPSGGYRGLENQLYRVEVHDVQGAAVRIKWSRENAHIASKVTEIFPGRTEIRLDRLGRDDLLRFKTGNWVEITSDARELSGMPGEMRQVTVNDTTTTLSFSTALPADLDLPALETDPDHHLRVIRWDQSGIVRRSDGTELINLDLSTDGLIPLVPADNTILLENGIQITLDLLGGGTAHTGDYWCSAARTADASIEILIQSPPLGIHHHFCALAIIETDGEIEDCRPLFLPLTELEPGCCSFVVLPGENIQNAIDALPPEGGCICLKTGDHEIRSPLRIEGSNIMLQGESPGARVFRENGTTTLTIRHPLNLDIENVHLDTLHFESTFSERGTSSPLLDLSRCNQTTISHCRLTADAGSNVVGVRIGVCEDVVIQHCSMSAVSVGLWVLSDSTALSILDNDFSGPIDDNQDEGVVGIFLEDAFGASRMERNRISGFNIGIALNRNLFDDDALPSSNASGSLIIGNRVIRRNDDDLRIGDKLFGIDVAAWHCVVRDNHLNYNANWHGGIRSSGPHPCIEGNRLDSGARSQSSNIAIGIQHGLADEDAFPIEGGLLRKNHITGPQHGIIISNLDGTQIQDNQIESEIPFSTMGIMLSDANGVSISGNRITNTQFAIAANAGKGNTIEENILNINGAAMTFFNQTALSITGNRIEDASAWGILGIGFLDKTAVKDNRLLSCGYEQSLAVGIGISLHIGELEIEANEILNTGVSIDGTVFSNQAFGLLADLVLECRVQGNLMTYSTNSLDANNEHRALWLRGFLEYAVSTSDRMLVFGFAAQILDNKFIGPGRTTLVEIQERTVLERTIFNRFERVFFNNNYCSHFNIIVRESNIIPATVTLRGRSAIVQGNHFKSVGPISSVNFNTIDGVYMGNIASGGPINFNGLPTPISGYNRP